MENLNKAGKIKIIVLIVCFLMNVLAPMNMVVQLNLLIAILFPILFGVIALPLIVKLNNSKEIMTPLWNDNPFTDNKPISFFHFGAFFFFSTGLGMILGTLIKFHLLNTFGLTSMSFGLGILIGIQLSLKWNKK